MPTILLTYTGKRWYHIGKSDPTLVDTWQDQKGNERVYKGLAGAGVGLIYEFTEMANGQITKALNYTGQQHPNSEDIIIWQAAAVAARTAASMARIEKRDGGKAQEDLDAKIEPLRTYVRHMRTRTEKDAVIAHIIQQLLR